MSTSLLTEESDILTTNLLSDPLTNAFDDTTMDEFLSAPLDTLTGLPNSSSFIESSLLSSDVTTAETTTDAATNSEALKVQDADDTGLKDSFSSVGRSLLSSSLDALETTTDLDLGADTLKTQDADDTLTIHFNSPSVGDLGSRGAIVSRSWHHSLFNDPIEYGNPIHNARFWRHQQGRNSCAVVAQISVYQSLTGRYISENAASNYAYRRGWFDPRTGTQPRHTGNILNSLGIQTYKPYRGTLWHLKNALARGDRPIVGLDANEIWTPRYNRYGTPLEQRNAGHAVWVTGIDYERNGAINIVLNDSGTRNGMASVVRYRDFMNAWQDYNCFVAIADNPFT